MKISKKLMLFEEFTEVKTQAPAEVGTQVSNSSIRTEIVSDVDTIINKLEDLANNLDSEKANESLNEGAAESMLSAELYMIPLIAAGAVTAGGVGVGILIKRALKKKKIKFQFNKKVARPKIEAAKKRISKKDADPEVKKRLSAEIDRLEEDAKEMLDALTQKYNTESDYLGALSADLNLKITELLIKSKALSPSEEERAQQTFTNSQERVNKIADKSNKDIESAKEKADNLSDEEREKAEAAKQQILDAEKENKDQEEDPKIKKIKDKIKDYEEGIEILRSKGDKKSKADLSVLQAALKKEQQKLKELEG